MKKFFISIVALSFLFAFVGCEKQPSNYANESLKNKSKEEPIYVFVKGTMKLSNGTVFSSADTFKAFAVPDYMRKNFYPSSLGKAQTTCYGEKILYQDTGETALFLTPGSTIYFADFNVSSCYPMSSQCEDWLFKPITDVFLNYGSWSHRVRVLDYNPDAGNWFDRSLTTSYPYANLYDGEYHGNWLGFGYCVGSDLDFDYVYVYVTNGSDSFNDMLIFKVSYFKTWS